MPSTAAKDYWNVHQLDLHGYNDPLTGEPNLTNADAPTNLAATPGTLSATITFTPGAAGSSPITNYEYEVGSGQWVALAPADTTSPVTIPNLVGGVVSSIRLRAITAAGHGKPSAPVTVTANHSLPGAPTNLAATPGAGSADISFTPGTPGSAPTTNHQYQVDGGTWTALAPADATSPVTVPGLTGGVEHSIALRAVNAAGTGPASSPVLVTPTALAQLDEPAPAKAKATKAKKPKE